MTRDCLQRKASRDLRFGAGHFARQKLGGLLAWLDCPLAMSNVQVKSVVTITNDHTKKHPWTPEVQTIENVQFIKVQRLSRDLTRFVSGKCLDLRKEKGHSLNGAYITSLMQLRNEAAAKAVAEATAEDDGAKKRTRRPRPSDRVLVDPFLVITMPNTDTDIRVLSGVGTEPLWMELGAEILEKLRDGILASDEGTRRRNKRQKQEV